MSRKSTVTVRFRAPPDLRDPNLVPPPEACADTELGGPIEPPAPPQPRAPSLTIVLSTALNGGRARTRPSSAASAASDWLSAELDIEFRPGGHCRRYLKGICWHPNPVQWPSVHPSGLDQGVIGLEDDGSGNPVISEDITVALPANPGAWIAPQRYECRVTKAPSYPEDRTPPTPLCEGPFYTSDTEDNPYLADNPGSIATGDHGARFDYRYYLVNTENLNNDITVFEGTATVSGEGGQAQFGNLQTRLSQSDINRAIAAAQSDPQLGGNPLADTFELYLEVQGLYGRVYFLAYGQCRTEDAGCYVIDCGASPEMSHACCERVDADQASEFRRSASQAGNGDSALIATLSAAHLDFALNFSNPDYHYQDYDDAFELYINGEFYGVVDLSQVPTKSVVYAGTNEAADRVRHLGSHASQEVNIVRIPIKKSGENFVFLKNIKPTDWNHFNVYPYNGVLKPRINIQKHEGADIEFYF